MRKILVLRGGALGDFIVTLPSLALLRTRWPAARIELVGNANAAVLALNRGLIDAVHSQHEARWSALFAKEPPGSPLADWLSEFDLVLNYGPDPEGELAGHFPLRAGRTFLSAAAMPVRTPAAAHYCEPLQKIGLATETFWVRLHPIAGAGTSGRSATKGGRAHPRGRTAIHPGSGSAKKNWSHERWLELMTVLAEPILIVLGEVETPEWSTFVKAHANDPKLSFAVNLPLEELIVALSHCARFLGHDSGISHLAAACGLPCLLLFGPTDPAMWAPPAPHARVIRRGPEVDLISVDDVIRALQV